MHDGFMLLLPPQSFRVLLFEPQIRNMEEKKNWFLVFDKDFHAYISMHFLFL